MLFLAALLVAAALVLTWAQPAAGHAPLLRLAAEVPAEAHAAEAPATEAHATLAAHGSQATLASFAALSGAAAVHVAADCGGDACGGSHCTTSRTARDDTADRPQWRAARVAFRPLRRMPALTSVTLCPATEPPRLRT